MSYPKDADKILKAFMLKASRYESTEMILLARKWQVVSTHLEGLIAKLAEKPILSADQLFKSEIYKDFLITSNLQVNLFNSYALKTVTKGQGVFAQIGLDITQQSLIGVKFYKININAVNNMIGLASDGSPLSQLFMRAYPESMERLTNTLINATALGYNPEKTARLLAQDMNSNLTRALRIARTEQMNVLRETSIMQMQQSGVCKGWVRIEQSDACDDCAEENGKEYDFNESFDSHPNCRGAALPNI